MINSVKAALQELVSALQTTPPSASPLAAAAAASALDPAMAASGVPSTTAAAAAGPDNAVQLPLQLQSLSIGFVLPMELAASLVQELPSSSLTELRFPLNWRNIAQLPTLQTVYALGRLTALCSCNLTTPAVTANSLTAVPTSVLASQENTGLLLFDRLQQLTCLHLDGVGRAGGSSCSCRWFILCLEVFTI
jgi:hypothetical protein